MKIPAGKFAGLLGIVLATGVLVGYCARGGVGSEALRQESARADAEKERADGLHEALLQRIAWDSVRLAAVRDSAEREIEAAKADRTAQVAARSEARASLDGTHAEIRRILEATGRGDLADSADVQLGRERVASDGALAALEREMEARVNLLTAERDAFRGQVDQCVLAADACHVALDSMTFNRDRWRGEAQKKGLNLGLVRVPEWVGYLVVGAGSLYIGSRL